jgi:hypothetical protein
VHKYFLSSLVFLLLACKPNTSTVDLDPFMVDVSEFKMDTTVLQNSDKVQILGCSNKTTKDQKIDFYNLVVVKSLATGDTINILAVNYFPVNLDNPEIMFTKENALASLVFRYIETGPDVKNLKLTPKKITKVLYDTEFIQYNSRHLPTITGYLGNYYYTETKNITKP